MAWNIPNALILIAAPLAAMTILLRTPVVLWIDSRQRKLRARWTFLVSYEGPWPGTRGSARLRLLGIPIKFYLRRRDAPHSTQPRPRKAASRRPVAPERRRRTQRFLLNCLLDGDFRGALARQFRRLPADLWNAVEVSRWRAEISLPDPALTGMLWGAAAALNFGPRGNLRCNFVGRTEASAEIRLYPHRALAALLRFGLHMPHLRGYRHWRTSQS